MIIHLQMPMIKERKEMWTKFLKNIKLEKDQNVNIDKLSETELNAGSIIGSIELAAQKVAIRSQNRILTMKDLEESIENEKKRLSTFRNNFKYDMYN